MAALYAPTPGTVVELLVDEGTMVAEEDPLLAFAGPDGPVVLAAVIPGVLREWYVEPGDVVVSGAPLALIDES